MCFSSGVFQGINQFHIVVEFIGIKTFKTFPVPLMLVGPVLMFFFIADIGILCLLPLSAFLKIY